LVSMDECDMLRDEGAEYAKKLSLAGVELRLSDTSLLFTTS